MPHSTFSIPEPCYNIVRPMMKQGTQKTTPSRKQTAPVAQKPNLGMLREFLEYLEIERGRSLKTLANYDHYLRRFAEISGINDPKNITEESVRRYRMELNRLGGGGSLPAGRQGLARCTQNYHLIALRAFLKFCRKRDVKTLAPEKIELARTVERDIAVPHPDELGRILSAPKGGDIRALRDRAMLETLFSTGLRVSELANLNRDSIDLGRGEFSIRGKGGKIRVVFLSDNAKDALKAYIGKREDIEEALFVGGRKKATERLTPRQMQRLVKHYAIAAGVSGHVTPHSLRHFFATDLLLNGADLRSVQSLLGHSSITTTQVYTHLTDRQLKDIHTKFHGKQRK